MPYFHSIELQDKNSLVLIYEGTNETDVGASLDELFKVSGYTLKSGAASFGSYEKGNRTMRILLGAFVKYYKFQTEIGMNDNEQVRVTITKATSGMSGGAIGVGQVKTEFERIAKALKAH